MRYPTGKGHLWAILADPVAHVRAAEFLNPLIERGGRDAFLVAIPPMTEHQARAQIAFLNPPPIAS